jgi:ribulose-phosphate 3-epimerase
LGTLDEPLATALGRSVSYMDASPLLATLKAAAPLIAPSLLAADLANLEREIHRLEEAGARVLHLDVMDGHFVPNLSFGLPVVEAVRRVTELPLDVHLMVSDPGRFVAAFREAGADSLVFHVEAVAHPETLLEQVRSMGAGAGIAISPPTPVERLKGCLDCCDYVLVMSVDPGFGGQQFHPEALEKLRWLRARVPPGIMLAVDGGINPDTIGPCAEAGAQWFIVGTALLGYPDYRQRMAELRVAARGTAPAGV